MLGFKPGFGLVDRRGVGALAPSLDTVGWFAGRAVDLALLLDVLAPAAARDGAPVTRVGLMATPHDEQADADERAALGAAAAALPAAGAEVADCRGRPPSTG